MANKYSDNYGGDQIGGGENNSNKLILSKNDFELYDEEKDIVAPIVRVKRVNTKTERWKIFTNDQLSFVVDGQKLNKKEREFLRGLTGITFLINEFKNGIKNMVELRKKMKDELIRVAKK